MDVMAGQRCSCHCSSSLCHEKPRRVMSRQQHQFRLRTGLCRCRRSVVKSIKMVGAVASPSRRALVLPAAARRDPRMALVLPMARPWPYEGCCRRRRRFATFTPDPSSFYSPIRDKHMITTNPIRHSPPIPNTKCHRMSSTSTVATTPPRRRPRIGSHPHPPWHHPPYIFASVPAG